MAWAWVKPVAEGIVTIIGGIFSNKKKNDAQKVADDSLARAQQQANQDASSRQLQGYIAATNPRFIELGKKLKLSVLPGKPQMSAAEMAEYNSLKAKDVAREDNPYTGKQNPITSPDGGYASGAGSSYSPFDIGEVSITGTKDKITAPLKQAGISPILMIGLLAAGGGLIYSQRKGGRKKRRR